MSEMLVPERSDLAVGQYTPPAAHPEAPWTIRTIITVAALLVLVALAPVATGLFGAVLLYELCHGTYARLARRLPSGWAATIVTFGVLGLVAAPISWLGYHLTVRLPAVLATINTLQNPPNGAGATEAMTWAGPAIAKATTAVRDWLPSGLVSLGNSLAWALLNWSIALLGLYYLLLSASDFWRRLGGVVPLSTGSLELLRVRLGKTSMAIVAGTLLSAAVQGAAIGLGFLLAGIPESLFWGVCGAITTLVPLVGNALVWLPGLAYMVITKQYQGAFAIAMLGGLGPPVIDRVVRATVSSRMGRVHPMITLVGALAGIRFAGVAGLIIGPVGLEMFFALLEAYRRDYTRAPIA